MFAIPAPLQRPVSELASTVQFNSNTATLPHPTQLSVSTPPSSLSKGDWGFKRNLPVRSTTKSSTPVIRVSAVDTFDHITEFGSAADHTLTLRKWQEMNMPLSTPAAANSAAFAPSSRASGRGVFEMDTDVTTADGDSASKDNRWKFNGPWLAGQTEGEFNEYVRQEIAKKRPEFRQFLQNYKASQDTKAAQRKAMEAGEEAPAPIQASNITEDEMRQYMRALRQDRPELFRLIGEFLDLPPAPSGRTDDESFFSDITSASMSGKTISAEDYSQKSNSPYANTGPPKTHPSAGLSYLRSNAYVANHPIFGPQYDPAPIQGRVILPKNAAVGSFAPKLGVAGIVTEVPLSSDYYNTTTMGGARGSRHGRNSADKLPGLINIEPEKIGGSKVYVKPKSASIDPKGRIQLIVAAARNDAVAVLEGTASMDAPQTPVDLDIAAAKRFSQPPTTSSSGYGLKSEDVNAFGENARRIQNERWTAQPSPRNGGRHEYERLESLLDELPKGN